jgi:type VI secretion system protein ImpF
MATAETLPEGPPEGPPGAPPGAPPDVQLDAVEGVIEGARPPLFDRLRAASSPEEPLPLGAYRRSEVYDSLRRELTGLFNTRSPTSLERYAVDDLTVLDFGVPDLTDLHPQSAVERGRLEATLARGIATFEPRLREVRVEVQALSGRTDALLATVQAVLHVGRLVEPVMVTAVLADDAGGQAVTVRPAVSA